MRPSRVQDPVGRITYEDVWSILCNRVPLCSPWNIPWRVPWLRRGQLKQFVANIGLWPQHLGPAWELGWYLWTSSYSFGAKRFIGSIFRHFFQGWMRKMYFPNWNFKIWIKFPLKLWILLLWIRNLKFRNTCHVFELSGVKKRMGEFCVFLLKFEVRETAIERQVVGLRLVTPCIFSPHKSFCLQSINIPC